jgi:RsiW-degrading membrane proteinase PrsW (M82 family)
LPRTAPAGKSGATAGVSSVSRRPVVSTPSGKTAASPGSDAATPRKAPIATLPKRPGRPLALYLVFAAALLPLMFQMLGGERDIEERLERTLAAHEEIGEHLDEIGSLSELLRMLPDGRIEGAHLSGETWMHWLYGILAAAAFIGAVRLSLAPAQANVLHWLAIAGLTATVGIVSLLAFQWIADFAQGIWVRGGGILVVVFYIVKFIGFSYRAALDPSNGFWLSFLGYTFGVGLCEEITKVLPAKFWLDNDKNLDWRATCALGLCSGVGFGVAEGIMYSSHYYNGMMTMDIYITRFISCVALHAVWAASAAIFLKQTQILFETGNALYDLLIAIAVPAVLHGLYDTLLKRDMAAYALIVAILSFIWLGVTVELARASEGPSYRRLARGN